MAIKLSESLIHKLYQTISKSNDVPLKLPIQGFLHNIVTRRLPYSVFVDSWPEYNVIITKPTMQQNVAVYRLGIYTHSPDSLSNILSRPDFLPEKIPIWIFGLPVNLMASIEQTAAHLKMDVRWIGKEPRSYVSSWKPPSESLAQLERKLSPSFYLSELDARRHSGYIASRWGYASDFYQSQQEAEMVTQYYIESQSCLGVFTKEGDTLVSWMLENVDGSVMMAQTLDEYKRQGLVMWPIEAYRHSKHASGDWFWGYVRDSNESVAQSLMNVGVDVHFGVKCMHCVMQTKVSKL